MSSESNSLGGAKCVAEETTSKKIVDSLTARATSSLTLYQRIEKKAIAICDYQIPQVEVPKIEGPSSEQRNAPIASDFSAVSFRLLQEIDDNLVRASAALRALDKFI